MKFTTSLTLTVLGLSSSARPAVVEEGVEEGETGGYSSCSKDYAVKKMEGWCAITGRKPRRYFTDHGYLWDDDYKCDGACCAGDEAGTKVDEICKCVHPGKRNTRKDSPKSSCCAITLKQGISTTPRSGGDSDTHCGCAENGMKIHYSADWGTLETDCCSGKWVSASNKTCIPKECTHKGKQGENCCGWVLNAGPDAGAHSRKVEGTCQCIPYNRELSPWQLNKASDCCSGAVSPGTKVCGCIDDYKTKLEHGAKATDCCSQQTETNDKGTFCKKGTCEPAGQSSEGGNHCCSKKESKKGETCHCLHGGETLPAGATAESDCCSGAADGGRCTYLTTGAVPHAAHSSPEKQCASGILIEGHCACVKPGVELKDKMMKASDCCSGRINSVEGARICSCVDNNKLLKAGTRTPDCCSRTAKANECVCAFAGLEAWSKTSDGSECCAGHQTEGRCGCAEKGKMDHPRGICCGGFQNGTSEVCSCVPDGVGLAPFVRASACCSGKKADGRCAEAGMGDPS